jgi:hypothetical protein
MTTAVQKKLIDDISSVLKHDSRIDAAWLAGSLGRNAGDAFSDVDVLVLCADGKAGEVSSAHSADITQIAKPILINTLFSGRVLNVVAQDWERFDLTFIESPQLPLYDSRCLIPLFNRGGREPPRAERTPYRTAPEQLQKLINEFFRVLGLATIVIGREEFVLALSGIEHLRRMTIDLMLEENAVGPFERGGALRLNPLLSAEQRRQLESVPPLVATRESVVHGHVAFAAIFLPRARRLVSAAGMNWPNDLAVATGEHLRRHLGVNLDT